MKKDSHLFSIIVAIYNTEEYLKECIDSVINQEIDFEDNIELILVNDGSTDNSEKICKEYMEKYPNNIRYIYQKNNGVSSARNKGLDICSGKYINFLDSDDKFSLNACAVVADIINKNKGVNIVSIRPEFFDRVAGNTNVEHCYQKNALINLIKDYNYSQQAVNNVFIKASLLVNHRFNEQLEIGEDAMFMNTLFIDHPNYYTTKDATYYQRRRQNNDSLSESSFKKKSFYTSTVKCYFKDIIKYSLKKYKTVPLFIQNDISAYIGWMLQSNIIDNVLTKKETKELLENLQNIAKHLDFDVIINNPNIELEYKYMILILKNQEMNISLYPEKINVEKGNDSINIEYIYANHSLNKYILDNDLKRLIVYCIEMNKFYVQHINKIYNLEKEIEEKGNQIKQLKKECDKILSSKSWEITKPLRKFSKIVSKRGNNDE